MAIFAAIVGGLSNLFFIIIGVMGIGFLIGFHEFGHFIFCKIFKIGTPTFSIGMGPKLVTKKIGDTNFSLSAIPLGGYVEIKGQESDEQGNETPDPNSFAEKPYYQKMLVIGGGIFFNLIFAYAVLSLLYFIGMPKAAPLYPQNASTVISAVEPNSPADKAGIQKNDKIIQINGNSLGENPVKLIEYIKDKPNQTVQLLVNKNNTESLLEITLGERTINKKSFGYLGLDFEIPHYSLIDSIKMGFYATNEIILQVFSVFKTIFTKGNTENLGGPLMVISQTVQGASKGVKIFLLLLAYISINLAVLNLIPVPIMDGGQALFYTIEAIIRRPLAEQIKIYIHYACWFGVIALTIFLSIKDVLRIFWTK
jgi:regulator of sigma E protease